MLSVKLKLLEDAYETFQKASDFACMVGKWLFISTRAAIVSCIDSVGEKVRVKFTLRVVWGQKVSNYSCNVIPTGATNKKDVRRRKWIKAVSFMFEVYNIVIYSK